MKLIRYFAGLSILFSTLILMTQCNKDEDEDLKNNEKRLLEQYLTENNITVAPTASGLYYIILEEGDGAKPVLDDFIEVQYTGELIDGTVFSTTYDSLAKEEDIYDKEIVYGPYRFQLGYTLPGLNEGIGMMHEGEKAFFILPSDIALGGSSAGMISRYSTLIYTIELVNVIPDPDAWERDLIQVYLDSADIDETASTDSLYYIETTAGTGELIKDQDVVDVYYTGYYLDGRVFDSNLGETKFTFSVPESYLITGWNKGIRKMRKGSKGTLLIPHKLGYGASGMIDQAGRTKVGPYMTILFDIEVVDVR
jgi:FKBP-type peptidyl-prolyl cis-trans isomerase